MSKINSRLRKMCLRKIKYPSQKEADDFLWKRYGAAMINGDMHSYKCPNCKDFHIGHDNDKVLATILGD